MNVRLKHLENGDLVAEYASTRYRFLLSDGSTVDVVALADDSTLRGEVLKAVRVPRIEGVAVVATEGVIQL